MRPRSLHVSWTKVSLAMLVTQVDICWGQFQSLGAIWKEYLLRQLYSLCHSAAELVAPQACCVSWLCCLQGIRWCRRTPWLSGTGAASRAQAPAGRSAPTGAPQPLAPGCRRRMLPPTRQRIL